MTRTVISHFYLGRVADTERYAQFLTEHYDREDDDAPLSEFYGSQGETFCDHDFLETGQRDPGESLEAFLAPYSYAEHWSGAVCNAARSAGLEDADVLLFIDTDQIAQPRSVHGDGFELIYLGPFEYPI